MGYGFKSGWLAMVDVTFPLKSHRNFKPYPASAKASRFRLFAFAQPAEVRLRASLFAQNDIQKECWLKCVCYLAFKALIPTDSVVLFLATFQQYSPLLRKSSQPHPRGKF